MKSFRDVLNGRMRTGKGRFVLASLFELFRKFAKMFVTQGVPPVSITPVVVTGNFF